jgi:SAM-dependent methyltransferase
MNVLRQPVPWDYHDVVLRYLRPSDVVLDVGTGAGERLRDLAASFGHGLGIDVDPEMVRLAYETGRRPICASGSAANGWSRYHRPST